MGVNATGTLGVAGRAPKTRESRCRRRRGGGLRRGCVPSQKIYEFFISKWCGMVHSGCVVFKIHVSQKYRWRETNKTLVKILRGRRHRTTPACQILGGHDPCNPCGVDAYDPSPYEWIRAPLNTCFLEPHQSTPRSVELCATDLRLFYWSYALSTRSGFYVTAGRSSVCLSVCLSYRPTTATAGLLRRALLAGDIDRQLRVPCWRRRRSAANAGSVMSKADGGGSTQTCSISRFL